MNQVLRAPFRRRAWLELAHVLVTAPLALAGFVYTFLVAYLSLLLAITRLGPPFTKAGLRGARGLGGVHRRLAAKLLGVRVPGPGRTTGKVPGWARISYDPAGLRVAGYLLLKLPFSVVSLYLVAFTWVYAAIGLTYPITFPLGFNEITSRDADGRIRHGLAVGEFYFDTWPRSLLVSLAGGALLLAAPWVIRGIVRLDLMLVRGLLGAQPAAERIRDLEETRALAVEDAAATLRQIERDLHDGAQVRLTLLTMQLTIIKDRLPAETPAETRELVTTAHTTAREAIAELRELVRGIHPPVLDKGLDVALASLAARSAVPVELTADLPVRPSPAIVSIAYFCAAELLANVAKHSGARRAAIELDEPDGTLRLRVRDDGTGGARPGLGSGLAGLADRIRPVDGALDIDSPEGGPSVLTVTLPLHTS